VSLIAGRYQPLDSGRPGARVRARDLQTAQTVILRDVRLPRGGEAAALARAQAAKGIFHPSLITLFDVVEQPEGRVLLAYEFVPSQSTAQVSGGHPFNPKRAAEIVTEVADAVAELHARGVAHGGISQGSVLITMKGKAKLDRVGDPTMSMLFDPEPRADMTGLADLLGELVGKSAETAGAQEMDAIVARVRSGEIASAATLAATLRRFGQ
jgi:serine/threonine protein kinase